MNKQCSNPELNYWGKFTIRTISYSAVLLFLTYLHHYKNIQGGTPIYDEFQEEEYGNQNDY